MISLYAILIYVLFSQYLGVRHMFMSILCGVQREIQGTHSASDLNPLDSIRFQVEERLVTSANAAGAGVGGSSPKRRVQQTLRPEFVLSLGIPLEAATNLDQVAAYERKKSELEATGLKMCASFILYIFANCSIRLFLTCSMKRSEGEGDPASESASVSRIVPRRRDNQRFQKWQWLRHEEYPPRHTARLFHCSTAALPIWAQLATHEAR